MDVVFQAAVMGLLQGITEFIPISSSAHLELAPWIFGWDESGLIGSLAFDVFLHLGTLVALLVYFARDWLRYLGAWWASIRERSIGGETDRKVAWLLVLEQLIFSAEAEARWLDHCESRLIRLSATARSAPDAEDPAPAPAPAARSGARAARTRS